MTIGLSARAETFALREAFTISRGTKTATDVVVAELRDGGLTGRGEGGPNARYGETPDSVVAQILDMTSAIVGGLDRIALQDAMPPGAARNALDCAFWDLEAKRAGIPAWRLAGLAEPKAVLTAFTLSVAEPALMEAAARRNAGRPLLKIKLSGAGDLERVRAVRAGAPAARLIVDANEAWTPADYDALAPELAALGVELIEQPLPQRDDAALAGRACPVPLCADESCRDRSSLAALVGRYELVNIKLDKTGGLTEALATAAAARAAGFGIMVGCMVGTSLAMAPALLVAQDAAVADLDGPLLLAEDRDPPLPVVGSLIGPIPRELWGSP